MSDLGNTNTPAARTAGTVPDGAFPLSSAQRGIWFAQQLDDEVPVTIAQYVELHGELDLDLLTVSGRTAGREFRSGYLRLIDIDGRPYQFVDRSLAEDLIVADLRAEPDPAAAARDWMRAEYQAPIDMYRDRLVVSAVLRLGDSHWYWYSRAHHVVLDGFGAVNLLARTAELYSAAVRQEVPEPAAAQQLSAIGESEAAYRSSARFVADRTYWTAKVAGLPVTPSLSGGGARAAHPMTVGGPVPGDTAELLRTAAPALGSHTAALIVAAFGAYLARMTDADEVVLSLPVSGRTTVRLRRSGGMLADIVPIRIGLPAGATIRDLVRVTTVELAAALRHQLYRQEDLRRDTGRGPGTFGPSVNIMMFHDETVLGDSRGALNILSTGPVDDLSVNVYPGAGGATRIDFAANPRLYGEAEIRHHHRRFLGFLHRMLAASGDSLLSDLDPMSDRERAAVPARWNAPPVPAAGPTLPDLIDARARRSPGAPAVRFADEELSYAAFHQKVNRLARYLVSTGVGPESVVAVAMRRSIDLVVAVHAVCHSGGTYLALDPDHPAERTAYVVRDARPVCVLTTTRDRMAVPAGTATVAVDRLGLDRFAGTPVGNAERRAPLRPGNTAYLTYTSGTMGRPKGIAVTHASITHYLRSIQALHPLDDTDVVVLKTPQAFDISIDELWWPLIAGATMVVAAPEGHRDPAYLAALIRRERVTVVHFVPSMLALFLSDGAPDLPASLRMVLSAGEELPPHTLTTLAARTGAEVYNVYGPAEATVGVTRYSCRAHDGLRVPVGGPTGDTYTYVLDRRLRPMAPGGIGELYLAGTQLARGYLGQAGTTAERFVANPFAPGARMYRTGDLARRRVDGSLEILGRNDLQVKVRGVRIELGEVEAELSAGAHVRRAAATVHDGDSGPRLVGYVVPEPGAIVDVSALLRSLRRRLPDYMMPESIIVLDAVPLNASGKLDRRALPAPARRSPERAGVAASTPVQRAIAAIFADVLGLERVGAAESFFALGGNSLVATRVVARVNAEFAAEIGVRDLFEAPTVAELADRVAGRTAATPPRPPLRALPRPSRIPLSPAQQRMWVLNRFDTTSPLYNAPLAVRLSGAVDTTALAAAVRDVLERHEALRTTFPVHGGEPAQVIVSADEVDIGLTPVAVDDETLRARVAELVATGFDLAVEVPLRLRLFHLGGDTFVLVVVNHHICGDGMSMTPLVHDLAAAYAARTRNRAPGWAPLPVQYADYAIWQRAVLGSDDDPDSIAGRQLEYWKSALAGLPGRLDLPADRRRPARPTFRGGRIALSFDAATHQGLISIAQEQRSTVFMAVHAALSVLLARLSGTTDIAVGTPVAGRGDGALDSLVGMFVNTLVLRVQVDPAESFRALLIRARDTDLEAFAHADVPFERVVELINPERVEGLNPLFQVMSTFQNMQPPKPALDGLAVEAVDLETGVSRYDLQLTLSDTFDAAGRAGGLAGTLTYSADLFDESTARTFARYLRRIVTAVVADPDVVVGDIELTDPAERAELLRSGNDSAVPDGAGEPVTLSELFGAQVARTPGATAVVCGTQELTYAELDRRVNRLARYLIARGVGPETTVGLPIRRSVDLLVAMYAVVRAGGAYLPIDPDQPAARTAAVLRSARTVFALAVDDVTLPPGTPVIRLDTRAPAEFGDAPLTEDARRAPLLPGNLAYVLFTSGSTGEPKGVAITHRSVVRSLRWRQSAYELGPGDTVLQKTPATFDASVRELWWPLTTGARLVIADRDVAGDPREIAAAIARHRVTVAHFVPSVLAAVIAHAEKGQLDSLRMVHCGGEVLQPGTVREFRAVSAATIDNEFGPTECTVSVTRRRILEHDAGIPIGRPQHGTGVYVLDGRLHPVPTGVTGELYVSGVQLARGYLARGALTAERFVADPFAGPGERMYRTGDLARRLPDGDLEFVGRNDRQANLRGLRIELGEVEAALATHSRVARCAAVVREAATGAQLVAYLVPVHGAAIDIESVRRTAAQTLPAYMRPAAYAVLGELPHTVHGKLDRNALPEIGAGTTAHRAPSAGVEAAVARVFGEVLGVGSVGAEDDFFAHGGNSLSAIRVVSRVKKDLAVELPLHTIFAHPTPAALTRRIEAARKEERPADDPAFATLLELRPGGQLSPLFCVHPIAGLSWGFAGLARYLHPARGIYGLQSPAILADLPPESIEAWARRYIDEIRAVQPVGPYHLLGWSIGGVLAHSMAVQLQADGADVALLAMMDSFADIGPETTTTTLAELVGGTGPGLDIDLAGRELDADRLTGLVAAVPGLRAAITPDRMRALVNGIGRARHLLRTHRPGLFRGDLLYLAATPPGAQDDSAHRGPGGWRTKVTGDLHIHRIEATHVQMTSPSAAAEIGPILNDHLGGMYQHWMARKEVS